MASVEIPKPGTVIRFWTGKDADGVLLTIDVRIKDVRKYDPDNDAWLVSFATNDFDEEEPNWGKKEIWVKKLHHWDKFFTPFDSAKIALTVPAATGET